MDRFSIPDRLEPVAPAENARRQSFTSDQRRRREQDSSTPTPKPQDDDASPPQDGEDSHNIDELV